MTFVAKREICWASAVTLFVPACFVVTIGLFFFEAVSSGRFPIPVVAGVLVTNSLAFYHLLPFLFTFYELTEDQLIVRAGLHVWQIPLQNIVAVEPSSGQFGMPAYSRDSLKIRYHRDLIVGDYVIISPRDRHAFLTELGRRLGTRPAVSPRRRAATA
jgi:hypothetical protein